MKTNQERAAEIFQRAATYQNTPEPTNRTKSRWTQPWVRVLASILVVVVLFGTGFGLFIGLRNRSNRLNSFDKMYIANFDNYKAIGAGGTDTTAEQILQTKSLNVASSHSNSKMYLVGVDQNNNVERCRVHRQGDKKNGKQYEINYYIGSIYAFERYTFVNFSTYDSFNPDYHQFAYSYCSHAYVIDNLTGKFYSLDVLGLDVFVYLGTAGSISDNFPLKWRDGFASDDGVFISTYRNYSNKGSIYKVYVKNDNLVLEEVFDYSLNLGVKNYFVDKFNNIYLIDASPTSSSRFESSKYGTQLFNACQIKYIISNGKLINASDIGLGNTRVFRSLNGICYNQDCTQYINANGELVENDFAGCNYFFSKDEKVKSVGNVDYYFTNVSSSSTQKRYELYRVTWEDDVKFNTEKVEYSRAVEIKDYAATQDYIYIIEENAVSRIEITTGKIEPLNSGYTFTAIQTDYLGNVIFNGNDTAMNKIVGVITNNGEISILTKAREYQIYYIAPVN